MKPSSTDSVATTIHYSFLGLEHRKMVVQLIRTMNSMEIMRRNMPYEIRLDDWNYNVAVGTADRLLNRLVKDGVVDPEKYGV